ncbi:MAG TPA: hypothetical protein VG478_12650 [Acidimicrobiales bacterium]|jgi:hypothetical protein|nr:hypothetical protein [Acidimicrobiales bacterium]
MSAEIHIFPNPLTSSGTFTAVVQDNAGVPTDVIEASLEFRVDCQWDIDPITAGLLGGTWHVDLYAESLGGGFEGRVGGEFVNVTPGQTNYAATIIVPANTFPNDPSVHPLNDQSHVFKMVVVLTHHNGNVTTSLCALQEGPAVLVR